MNTQQRLADIQNLLQYVKGVVDTPMRNEVTEVLDDIGKMTLSIVNNLRLLDDSINTAQKENLESYAKDISITSSAIMEKLATVQQTITTADTTSREGVAQIQTLCNEYQILSQQCMDTYTQQATSTTNALNALCEDGKQTNTQIKQIQDALIDKEYLTAFMNDFTNLVAELKTQDDVLDKQTQVSMNQITTHIDSVTTALSTIGEQLQSIENGFQTSVGRLNVIDIKLDTITEVVTGRE